MCCELQGWNFYRHSGLRLTLTRLFKKMRPKNERTSNCFIQHVGSRRVECRYINVALSNNRIVCMLVYTTNHAVRSSVFLRGDKNFGSIFGCWTNVLVQVNSVFADLCWFCYRLYDVIRILIVDVANIFGLRKGFK